MLFFLETQIQEAQGAGGDSQVSAGWYHIPFLLCLPWVCLVPHGPLSLLGRQQDLKGSVKSLLTVVCHLKWGSEHQEKRPAPRKW